jgi:UDP-glucose 4-epimerase
MRILITGGAGFIGSHLADKLLELGHSVKVLDNLSTGRIENLSSVLENSDFEFISGSILDLELLKLLIADADYVFHLAAAVGVFNIVNNPLSSLLTNIRGTENVLEIASQSNTPVFLTSSSEVYGKNISTSLKEVDDRIIGSPVTLRWSYSEAKAVDESLAFAYFIEKQLPVRIVRFFNTVGPRQLGAYGMVVPRFVQSALSNAPITIYGDGNQTRCFAHIQDVIDAVIATAFVESTIGKVINIGNNFEISINHLAEKIIADTESKSEIVHIPYAEAYGDGFEDMERRVPNLDLIYELVGWKPLRDLTQIIYDISTEMKKDLEKSNSI